MKKLLSLIFAFSLFTVVVSAQTVTKTEQAEIKTAVKKDVNTAKTATYTKKEVKAEAVSTKQIVIKDKEASATKAPSKVVSTSKTAVANPKMTESKTKAATEKKAVKIKSTESTIERKSNSPK